MPLSSCVCSEKGYRIVVETSLFKRFIVGVKDTSLVSQQRISFCDYTISRSLMLTVSQTASYSFSVSCISRITTILLQFLFSVII